MENKINEDLKKAMLSKDTIKVETLRSIKTAFTNAKAEKNATQFDDQKALKVIEKLLKQRNDSITIYTKAGRADLVEKEVKEAEILSSYLPAYLSGVDLVVAIDRLISELNATKKDFGMMMKAVSNFAALSSLLVDGKAVSEILREKLV